MLIRLLAALALVLPLAAAAQAAPQSSIRKVEITRTEPAGTFGGVAFRRIQGVIHGEVAASEPVAGLREVAAGRDLVPYDTSFDLLAPVDPAKADGVIVEANNRGMPVLLGMMSAPGSNAPPKASASGDLKVEQGAIRDGFLFDQRLSLAHVQWQTGIAPGVPPTAQGIGEVIVRDFGRLLAGGFPQARAGLPVFRHRILAGVSQSAWLVNSVIAEGFNVDPQTGGAVFQGAFTRDGAGVVMAINRFAGGGPQSPYVPTEMTPLTPAQLLSRPNSDPVLVDITAFTDFYRVRASVFARAAAATPKLHRYATAAAHAPGTLVPQAFIFGKMQCNGGVPVPMNPINDSLYLRPLLLGLAKAIGIETATPTALPPEAGFVLTPAPPGLKEINRLGDVSLWVPKIGPDGAAVGGVGLIDAVLPLGTPDPPALPPVGTSSISDTCGNFSGWKAFPAEELTRRYGSRAAYLGKARAQAASLVKAGYLLKQDAAAAVELVAAQLPAGFQ